MKGFLATLWRRNPWLISFFIFGLSIALIKLAMVEWHNRTPGGYKSPEKVQQRILLAKIRLFGTIFFLGMAVWRERRYIYRDTRNHD